VTLSRAARDDACDGYGGWTDGKPADDVVVVVVQRAQIRVGEQRARA